MQLSIVICNYNYAQYLDGAIASAIQQTYPDTEVIVIDDGSTDSSVEIIRRWLPKVRLVEQRNAGQLAAYNRGYEEARGDVIIFLDSDDLLDLDAGEKVVAGFRDPAVTKVHFRLRLVDAIGRSLGSNIPRRLSEGDVSGCLKRGVLYDSSPGSGNAYRRSSLGRLIPLPVVKNDLHAADFFALQGVALLGQVRIVGDGPLGAYRVHGEQATTQVLFGNARLRETTRARERYSRLRAWLLERLGPGYEVAETFDDFSIEKLAYASIICEANSYSAGLKGGFNYLSSKLMRSIWRSPAPVAERIGLTGWAVAVLLLPRKVALPIARYVCNPASRGFAASS
jgi:glycosyltransferase involved in cell wall biosynthesis